MTIYIIATDEDITFWNKGDNKSIRIEKPCAMEDAKKQAREAWDLIGEKITWKTY